MNIFVLIGHQNPGSFCHAIAARRSRNLKAAGHEVVYHDLYAEKFDPILPHEEIPKEADSIRSSSSIAAKSPRPTAILSCIRTGGRCRRRFSRAGSTACCARAWPIEFPPSGVEALLTGRRAVVFTTSNTPRDDELRLFGDPLENLWKACVFGFCGVEDFYRRNFESIIMSTPEQRAGWLEGSAANCPRAVQINSRN